MNTLRKKIITAALIALALISSAPIYALEYSQTLSRGSSGDVVTELQECLVTMEYDLPVHGADGWYGTETFLAVSLYQEANNLSVDGIAGKRTIESMDCNPPEEQRNSKVEAVDFELEENGLLVEISGVITNSCSSLVNEPQVVFVDEDARFDITVKETLPYEAEECEETEEEYIFETRIDTSDLVGGEYSVMVNEDDDFEYRFEIAVEKEGIDELAIKQPTQLKEQAPETKVNNTSVSSVSSSYSMTQRDTALFNFKMNLNPFDDAIYVPAVADASVDIEVYTDAGVLLKTDTYSLSVRSEAEIVTGVDGNNYYKVNEPEIFIYTATAVPGAGSYYARLVSVSFTSQNVMKREYKGFSGLTLDVDPEMWTTTVVELGA